MEERLFLAFGLDGPEAPRLRAELLEDHLRWVAAVHPRLRVAGPLRAGDGRFVGSVLIVAAADAGEAEALLAADPYRRGGVWREVRLHAFEAAAGTWVGGGRLATLLLRPA
ncbi:MAG: YciI family protein [Xanthomonadales bacterium]|nr:YciI family protein [Xanthomonadales bacterium]